MIRILLVITFGLLITGAPGRAEIFISAPISHTVFQRNQTNEGLIRISGYYTLPYTRLEARLIPLPEAGAGSWTPLDAPAGQGIFRGALAARGGWYKLEIRGTLEQGETDTVSVNPVGIGEVFLVAGHSNAMGLPNLGSRDGSDRVVSFSALNKYLNSENITVAPDHPMPAPVFGQLKAEKYIFPSGESAWNWGELGTLLANRLGVPVLFMNAGWAAANSINWREAAEGRNTRNIYVNKDWPNRQPYSNLINTLRYYHSWLGIRAVLWFHGENDAFHLKISQSDYYTNIHRLIELTRQNFGHELTWAIALCSASFHDPNPYLPVLNAQIQLTEAPDLTTWKGPYTDTIQVPRPEHGHFENRKGGTQGLTELAQAWNRTLTNSFFTQRPAFTPTAQLFSGVVPGAASPGHTFHFPFYLSGSLPDSTRFEAQLLTQEGQFVAVVGTGTQSPLRVTLPVSLADGQYRVRVVASNPVLTGNASGILDVKNGLPSPRFIRSLKVQSSENRATVHALLAAHPDLVRLTLERSDDRTNFQPIGSQTALSVQAGTSALYSFTDPQPSSRTAYYRIRLETRTGAEQYSHLVADFRGDVPAVLVAFPNPASAGESVFVRTDFPEAFSYQLYDTKGTAIPIALSESDIIGLSVLQPAYVLPPGLYFLQITRGTTTQTQRLMIR